MTRDEADRLVEGDRVTSRKLAGTVVGTTANCVSIQWDGRETPEIYAPDDMRQNPQGGGAMTTLVDRT
jgi:hypothetical protein